MNQRYAQSPKEVMGLNTGELRESFLIDDLMQDDAFSFTYSHYDRAIVGSAKPVSKKLELPVYGNLRADYFLERRELGIINVGGNGNINVDGTDYQLSKLDALYVGKGSKQVTFSSASSAKPALFYLYSVPAHKEYPVQLVKKENASPTTVGSKDTANERTIYKYIHLEGAKSCQLVMGLTILSTGCVWNTMPAHTHDRRMEAYFYFDVPDSQVVFHFMGQPQETRHLVMKTNQAVISPPWSIHSGAGTSNYGFIWAMAGENLVYSDMDAVSITDLK
ncbi:5-dehydro-4-deoxy-D-glucuronate isomerase [Pedobacter sp. HMF7647]|uniref:4-deoxy-L-threo-5-hexosulose-uronate ketol-isomerase n=1 Tax=Hufsiella arboris TaxID=2695275 RepID=A0A7K1Y636_9SPHI|nr:5-dehydro-4-deoxy-D-glucuronate isomerase [Hufsiella arboris]MXV49488.1 5-dehydro-4-deoxy-D-glucuronate isomerase [Hufsiella arboris]